MTDHSPVSLLSQTPSTTTIVFVLALVVLLITTTLILILFFNVLIKPYLESKKPLPDSDIPMADGCHWFLGHVHITSHPEKFPLSYLSIYRDDLHPNQRCSHWVLKQKCVSIMNIQDARYVLKTIFHRDPVPIISHYISKAIGHKNLLFLNGREWKQNRTAVSRTFTNHTFLKQSQQDVYYVCQDLIHTLQTKIDGGIDNNNNNNEQQQQSNNNFYYYEVDVIPIMKMITSDVIGRSVFSTYFNCSKTLQSSSIISAFEYIMKDLRTRMKYGALLPWNYWFWLPTKKNKLFHEQVQKVRTFIQNLINESRSRIRIRRTIIKINTNNQMKQQQLDDVDDDGTTTNDDDDDGPIISTTTTTTTTTKQSLVDRLVAAHDDDDDTDSDENNNNTTTTTDQVLIDVICTLLFASYDTTSTALSFALYSLAQHPDIQDKCYEEVRHVLLLLKSKKRNNNNNTGEEEEEEETKQLLLSCPDELVYCNAVIQETLRLYPPAALSGRTITKPLTLPSDGFVLPKDVRGMIPIFAIHRSEKNFVRPLECIPERWCCRRRNSNSSTNGHNANNSLWVERDYHAEKNNFQSSSSSMIEAGNPDALLAFSAGARNCPGAKFAQQEAVIVLANLVQHFRFKPVPNYILKLNLQGPLPYPKHGMPLRIEKR